MQVIKFKPIKEQSRGATADLDDSLIPFWHIIQPPQDYTTCGQATDEYKIITKSGKITCPECLKIINFYKQIILEMVKENGNK